jgi:hypothetical protein
MLCGAMLCQVGLHSQRWRQECFDPDCRQKRRLMLMEAADADADADAGTNAGQLLPSPLREDLGRAHRSLSTALLSLSQNPV